LYSVNYSISGTITLSTLSFPDVQAGVRLVYSSGATDGVVLGSLGVTTDRLNAGNFALVGGHRVQRVYRTDLIGSDVDRFFRITKEALPGCVMVGASLYDCLSVAHYEIVAPDLQRVELLFAPDVHRPDAKVRANQILLCRTTEIPEKDLKGVGKPYTVRHLIPPEELRGIWNMSTRNDLLGRTVEKLPRTLRREYGRRRTKPRRVQARLDGFAPAKVRSPPSLPTLQVASRRLRVSIAGHECLQRAVKPISCSQCNDGCCAGSGYSRAILLGPVSALWRPRADSDEAARTAHGPETVDYVRLKPDHALAALVGRVLIADAAEREVTAMASKAASVMEMRIMRRWIWGGPGCGQGRSPGFPPYPRRADRPQRPSVARCVPLPRAALRPRSDPA
jgi:hypothetical protein